MRHLLLLFFAAFLFFLQPESSARHIPGEYLTALQACGSLSSADPCPSGTEENYFTCNPYVLFLFHPSAPVLLTSGYYISLNIHIIREMNSEKHIINHNNTLYNYEY